MAKGPLINDSVKMLIAEVYLQHKDWKGKQVQKEVQRRLKEINPATPDNWPALSTTQTILKDIIQTNKLVIERGIDQPWSMTTLDKYPIAAEAIPYVLKAWIYYLDTFSLDDLDDTYKEIVSGAHLEQLLQPFFSIRYAKWVSRLYKVIEDIPSLTSEAITYADHERLCEISGADVVALTAADVNLYKEYVDPSSKDKDWTKIINKIAEYDTGIIVSILGEYIASALYQKKITKEEFLTMFNDPKMLVSYCEREREAKHERINKKKRK